MEARDGARGEAGPGEQGEKKGEEERLRGEGGMLMAGRQGMTWQWKLRGRERGAGDERQE